MFFRQVDPTGSIAHRYSLGPLTLFVWVVNALRRRRIERAANDRRRVRRASPVERRSGRDRRRDLAHAT